MQTKKIIFLPAQFVSSHASMKIERDALLQVIMTTNVDPALKNMKKMQVLTVFLFLVSGSELLFFEEAEQFLGVVLQCISLHSRPSKRTSKIISFL